MVLDNCDKVNSLILPHGYSSTVIPPPHSSQQNSIQCRQVTAESTSNSGNILDSKNSITNINTQEMNKDASNNNNNNNNINNNNNDNKMDNKKEEKITLRADYKLPSTPTKNATYKAVTDSGATENMSAHPDLFEEIIPLDSSHKVTLGDDVTKLSINGYGWMNFTINNKRIRTIAYYVPDLGTTLLSIKHHSKFRGNYFHTENNTAVLAYATDVFFPECTTEYMVDIQSAPKTNYPYIFNEETAIRVSDEESEKYTKNVLFLNKTKANLVTTPQHQSTIALEVKIKKIVEHAVLPKQATAGSIGYDLWSSQDATLKPNSTEWIHTGIAMEIPKGLYGRVAPRSSLSLKGLSVGGGVIDIDFRSEVMVILHNHTNQQIHFPSGTKIAQMIFEHAASPCITVAKELSETSQGGNGFGSTDASQYSSQARDDARQNAFENVVERIQLQYKDMQPQQPGENEVPTYSEMSSRNNPVPGTTTEDDQDNLSVDTVPASNCTEDNKIQQQTPGPSDNQESNTEKLIDSQSTPPILPTEKLSSSTPNQIRLSRDFVAQATGYHKSNLLMKYFDRVAKDTTTLDSTKKSEVLVDGEIATIRSKNRNKNKSPLPKNFSDVWHMDIVYGPCTAIGGIKYALLLIDKKTRKCYIYGLTNMKGSIKEALQKFVTDVQIPPKLIRTDFDKRLMGG